jgi:hypothetical protein
MCRHGPPRRSPCASGGTESRRGRSSWGVQCSSVQWQCSVMQCRRGAPIAPVTRVVVHVHCTMCSAVSHNVLRCTPVLEGTRRAPNLIQPQAGRQIVWGVQCSSVQCCAVQCSAVQFCTSSTCNSAHIVRAILNILYVRFDTQLVKCAHWMPIMCH